MERPLLLFNSPVWSLVSIDSADISRLKKSSPEPFRPSKSMSMENVSESFLTELEINGAVSRQMSSSSLVTFIIRGRSSVSAWQHDNASFSSRCTPISGGWGPMHGSAIDIIESASMACVTCTLFFLVKIFFPSVWCTHLICKATASSTNPKS